ncbi:RnfABCDGE type electron transport complex subunit D [Peptoniphilus equinus]|uniref:Ion-translocating oxidoreductase complex subunit D n=1 Tax=Peptoniphilus equinus TaxID=3016343 RepID=A0ABY7QUV0_9FIRM|nr:RnfABCDGE type electron transport complex subunit D [Peptoniphilus equinus]WBW50556.1 RnfABCDGE type electron transport complex subunit D [Peptoniphilus equinus]
MDNTKQNPTVSERFVSLAPHVRSNDTTQKIMRDVIIALVPAMAGSIYFFGMNAAMLMAVCVASCVLAEFIFQKAMKKEVRIGDLSAVVTGILIAFNLPATAPWWMAAFGSAFAIIVIKECFGGIGSNFMNPAIGARIVIMASWAKLMTDYVSPEMVKNGGQLVVNDAWAVSSASADAVAYATPLGMLKAGTYEQLPSLMDMATGNIGGVIGETSAILLLIGALYLIVRKVMSPLIPVVYIATTAVVLVIAGVPVEYLPYHILGGGLILGAFFMATDYASSPINVKGKIIFAIGCGVVTAVIRTKASLPEGVSYAIALMNVCTPLIDRLTRTEAYGEAK